MMKKMDSKKSKTTAKIVSEAVKVFAKHGFMAGSFQLIADKCKMSQTAILYYFPNKNVLFEAVLKHITLHNHQIVSDLVLPTDNAYQRIIKHFKGNLDWGMRFPEESQILVLLYYLACFDGNFSEQYTLMLDIARSRLCELVLAGEREHLFKLKLSAKEISIGLHDALLGCFVNELTTREFRSKKSSIQALEKKYTFIMQQITGYEV